MKHMFARSLIFVLSFLLVCIGADALQLLYPADNSVVLTSSITFQWSPNTNTLYSEIEVADDTSFTEPFFEGQVNGTSKSITLQMDGRTYYWRVRCYYKSCSGCDYYWSSWSNVWSFTCAISVPYVVSMDRVEAASTLQTAGLVVGQQTEEYSAYIPANHVIRQDPASGTIVAPGTAIKLTISYGPEPLIAVPSLLGYTQDEAEDILTDFDLKVGTITGEFSDTVPLGKVIRQSPPEGTSVNQGSPVNLVISYGAQPVSVPNLAGMTSSEASAVLLQKGLILGQVTEQYSETVSFGRVISQMPFKNTMAESGSSVSIVISRGKAPIEGEVEVQDEGEGESASEGECVEGENAAEGEVVEGEGEPQVDAQGGCTRKALSTPKRLLGDWLLVGMTLICLAATKRFWTR